MPSADELARRFEDVLIALQAEAPAQLIGRIGELAQANARELAAARAETWREALRLAIANPKRSHLELGAIFKQRAAEAQDEEKTQKTGDTDEAKAGMPGISKSDAPLRRTPSAGKSGWEASGDRQSFESSDDSLREEAERRMRARLATTFSYGRPVVPIDDAIEVAVEMIRLERRALAEMRERWGHVRHCDCYSEGPIVNGAGDEIGYQVRERDPRCAPPGAICDLCLGKDGYYPAELDSDFQNCPKCTEPEAK